jgi:hypothetical protein
LILLLGKAKMLMLLIILLFLQIKKATKNVTLILEVPSGFEPL